MKEIKFRIWDRKEKQFVESANFYINSKGGLYKNNYWEYADNLEDCCYQDFEGEERYLVQQFSGLKDKKFKEIYEGDLINGRIWVNDPNGKSGWAEITKREVYFASGQYKATPLEVLGNIYEIEIVGNINHL